MYPYLEIHREYLYLVFLYGGIGLFGLALALGARRFVLGRPTRPEHDHLEQWPDGVKEGHGKVPVFLLMLYVSLGLWAVLYVVAHAFWGMEFGG
jgi:hypothetical protein